MQFYNTATQTAGWLNGSTWYILHKLPKGATVASLRSQSTVGDVQLFDLAGEAPTTLGSEPITGLHCLNINGFPGPDLDGTGADTNTLQLNLEIGAPLGGLDPAGAHLMSTADGAIPVDGDLVVVEGFGMNLNFGGLPSGDYQLLAGTPGAEPLVELAPGVFSLDGRSSGSFIGGLDCASLVAPLQQAGVDPCEFADIAAIAEQLGLDPSQIQAVPFTNQDGSLACAFIAEGSSTPFAGATYSVRLEGGLDLLRDSLAACDLIGLPVETEGFAASCPDGVFQIVILSKFEGPGTDEYGLPVGFTLLPGTPELDPLLEDLAAAVDAGDAEEALDILDEIATGDPFGPDGYTALAEDLIQEARSLVRDAFEDED